MKAEYTSEMTGLTRVALYYRVSTEEQRRHGYSLGDQRRALRQHAQRQGYAVVEEIGDEGLSGADPYRPGLLRILELSEARKIDLVLATKRNRLFRDLYLRRGFERDLSRHRVRLKALDDTDNPIADGVMDLLSEEQRREIARETRRGRMQRARSGRVVASAPPYGFRFNHDNTSFVVEEAGATVVRRVFRMLAAGHSVNGVKSALEKDSVPAPRGGKYWSRPSLRQMVNDEVYKPHTREELEGLVEEGLLARGVLDGMEQPDDPHGVWWFNRLLVESYYEDDRKRRSFTEPPREERVAVPVPDLGVPREHVEEARRGIQGNRAPSSAAGRRFWDLSGGVLFCKCGRRMATHTVKRKGGRGFYYVCGQRRSGRGRCEHGAKYHPAQETERRVRAFLSRLLQDPETLREQVERQAAEERRALRAPEREVAAWKERLASLGRKRSGYLDQQAEGLISMAELREKLDSLETERERAERKLRGFEDRDKRLRELEALPDLVEAYLRDLPHILARTPGVREYETVPAQRTDENPLGVYTLTPERIRHLQGEELEHRRRAAADEEAARYREMYDALGFRVTAHPDGTLEVGWKFGKEPKLLRTENDASPNRHATAHFHATEHPLVQSFQPGEDWIWCYVDEVVMEPRR